jgi:Zn finger protein HypA/HybF involved in hydrogenase expression
MIRVAQGERKEMKQAVFCEECKTEMEPIPPPFPPQICNGAMMSTMAMMNGRAECPNCHAKYVTQIMGVNVQLGFKQVKDEEAPRIIAPPPGPTRIK